MRTIVKLEPESFESFYCPVCGKELIGENSDGEVCEHVICMYVDALGDFTAMHKSLEDPLEEYANLEFPQELDEYLLLHTPYALENTIIFSITTSGMACGPCSNNDIIAICFDSIDA